MKSVATALSIAILLLAAATRADSAASPARGTAEELLTLTDVEAQIAGLRGEVEKMMLAPLETIQVDPSQRAKIDAAHRQISQRIDSRLSFEAMKGDYVDAYTSTFTAGELKELVAFYKTPLGQTFLKKMPAFAGRMVEISQARVEALLPEIKQMTQELMADISGR